MRISLETTKRGLPAMWEHGGGYTNSGSATIVAGPNGEALAPIYVRRRGSLACEKHALFPIGAGNIIIDADQHRGDFQIRCYRISRIMAEDSQQSAELDLICEFSNGEWDVEPPELLEAAIQAAREKAKCYHCREPHYVIAPAPREA